MSRLKRLGKDSIVYGIGGILAKGTSFLLLPVYTRIFTPAQYGVIEMLTVLTGLLSTVMVMGMDSAQSMYFYKYKKDGVQAQARLVSSILQWKLIWGLAVVLVATLLAPVLNNYIFAQALDWKNFAIAFAGALFFQVMTQSTEVLRLLYRPWKYIGITLGHSLVSAALILVSVTLFEQKILGYFLGVTSASLLLAVIGWLQIKEYIQFRALHMLHWPQLIRFGLPLIPAGLAFYFMSAADRWFIQFFHGAETLGIYAIGAKFAMLMSVAVDTFRKAWWPIAMDAMHSDDALETFRMIARLYLGLACAAAVGLALLSPFLVPWLTGPEFHDAWPIVSVLAWQSVFYGFFLIASAGIWKTEKTYLNLLLMVGASAIGASLNWALVPKYGAVGAAVATAITYAIWIVSTLIVSELLWKVEFPYQILGFQFLLAASFTIWFSIVPKKENDLLAWSFGLVAIAILLVSSLKKENFKKFIRKKRIF